MKHYLIILILSLAAVISHGYQYAVSDQEIFIPYILRWKDSSFFPNDHLFSQFSSSTSIFYPLVGQLNKFIELEVLFVISYFLFQFLFFCSIYYLAKVLLKNKNLAYLSLFPFFLPKFIGGTATQTFDIFFGYRSIGVIFLIFYLSFLLEKRFLKAAITAAVGALFHPLSIIPVSLLLPTLLLKINFKVYVKKVSISLLVLIFMVLLISQLLPKDNSWFSIIKLRDDYLFPSNWSIRAWAALALYISLILLFIKNLKPEIRRSILLITVVSLSLFVTNIIILEISKNPLFAQFQLVRSVIPLPYIALSITPIFLITRGLVPRIFGAISFVSLCMNLFNLFLVFFIVYSILRLTKRSRLSYSVSPFLVIIVITSIIILNFFQYYQLHKNFREKIQFPKQSNDWINLQSWAKDNTQITSVFLVPPNQSGFRIFSHRSIIGDIKDGAVVIYSPDYATYWRNLMKDLNAYDRFDMQDFTRLSTKYRFDYLITTNNQKLGLPLIYHNKTYSLYEISHDKPKK